MERSLHLFNISLKSFLNKGVCNQNISKKSNKAHLFVPKRWSLGSTLRVCEKISCLI